MIYVKEEGHSFPMMHKMTIFANIWGLNNESLKFSVYIFPYSVIGS